MEASPMRDLLLQCSGLAAIAASPEHCSKRSRIGFSPYMTVWSISLALAAVNTVVYGDLSQEEV